MTTEMRRPWWLAGVFGIVLGVSACGGSDDEAALRDSSSEPQESQAMPLKDSAFGDMTGTMDRARGVEATGMEHKEAVDRAIEQDASSAPAE